MFWCSHVPSFGLNLQAGYMPAVRDARGTVVTEGWERN